MKRIAERNFKELKEFCEMPLIIQTDNEEDFSYFQTLPEYSLEQFKYGKKFQLKELNVSNSKWLLEDDFLNTYPDKIIIFLPEPHSSLKVRNVFKVHLIHNIFSDDKYAVAMRKYCQEEKVKFDEVLLDKFIQIFKQEEDNKIRDFAKEALK